jgi:hypothetical protein
MLARIPTLRSATMKKLVLETTAPFQGLPELVAYDEGLFEKEGRCRLTSPSAAPTAWSITPSTSSISTASICAQHRLSTGNVCPNYPQRDSRLIEACDRKGPQGARHFPAAYTVKPGPHEFVPTRTPWAFTPSTFANEAAFGAAIRFEKN